MFQVLILTHGQLGQVLLDSARTIAGEVPNVEALTLAWEDTFEEAHAKVEARLADMTRRSDGDGVLILTDMYGGTPFNVARTISSTLPPGRVEIVTGVNLPMVVRLSCFNQEVADLAAAATWILGKGQGAICQCTHAPAAGDPTEAGCD